MPHLSPMIWILAPLMFLLLILPIITSSLWWSQMPYFPLISNSASMPINKWNWN